MSFNSNEPGYSEGFRATAIARLAGIAAQHDATACDWPALANQGRQKAWAIGLEGHKSAPEGSQQALLLLLAVKT